jgi:hypothetical protein
MMLTGLAMKKVADLVWPMIKKQLASKIKPLQKYVFEKNDLDIEMEGLRARVNSLEKMSHIPKEIICKCKCKTKEKK